MKVIKNLINQILGLFGYKIIKKIKSYDNIKNIYKKPKITELDEIHQKLLNNSSDKYVIFDVGAHLGESINRFKNLFPNSIIHSFEADKDNFSKLENNIISKGYNNIFINNFACGDNKRYQTFFRNIKSNTSSFHKPNLNHRWVNIRSEQFNVKPEDFVEKTYEVEIRKLDDYVTEKQIDHIDLLKIDTQVFEDKVLLGFKKMIDKEKISIIELEIIIGNQYETQLSFYQIEEIISPDYKFIATKSNDRYNLFSNPDMCFVCIYVNTKMYKKHFTI